MTIELNKYQKTLIALFVILALSVLTFINIKGILLNCFHATDFGIYQQAIYEIASTFDPNPYLTVRNIKIFNDHFDPIIYLAVPFVWLTNYSPVTLILFELLWFFGVFFYVYKKSETSAQWLLYSLFIILSKGVMTGFGFPIHPTTWSMLPAFILGVKIIEDDEKWIIFLALSLLLFKEAFAFGIIGLSGYYLLRKRLKLFFILFFPALLNVVFVYFLRPVFMGEISSYAGMVLGGGIPAIANKLLSVDYKAFFKVFYPFFIPLFIIFRQKIKHRDWFSRELGVLFYIIPLFLIHWLTNSIHFQYGLLMVSPLLALVLFSSESSLWIKNKKILSFSLFLFFLSSMGTHTKNFKSAFASKNKSCTFSKDRISAINQVNEILKDETGPIMATGGAIPSLMRPGMKVYQARLFREKLESYDWMLIEKPGTGNHYPFVKEQIIEAVNKCANENKIVDNKWFLLLKKPSRDCFLTLR